VALEIRTAARSTERRAVSVQRWSVDRLIAGAARRRGVPAAVAEASDVADEGLIGPEWVAVWAVLWCPHHPRARSGPD
jgi:hypothetical protein